MYSRPTPLLQCHSFLNHVFQGGLPLPHLLLSLLLRQGDLGHSWHRGFSDFSGVWVRETTGAHLASSKRIVMCSHGVNCFEFVRGLLHPCLYVCSHLSHMGDGMPLRRSSRMWGCCQMEAFWGLLPPPLSSWGSLRTDCCCLRLWLRCWSGLRVNSTERGIRWA